MLQFFRSNQFSSGFLLIFYALLLRLPAWWIPAGELNGSDPGSGVLGKLYLRLGVDAPTTNILLPIIVVFFTGLYANHLSARHRMSKLPTQFPGLVIILLASLSPALLGLHSSQLANLFLLLSVGSVFKIYQSNYPTKPTFNAGFWLGLAVLFNGYFLIFLLLLFVSGVQLGAISGKMLLRFLAGTLLPLFLVGAAYFWTGSWAYFYETQFSGFFDPSPIRETPWNLGGLAVLLTALSFTLFRQYANVKLLVIGGRKKVSILYFWLFFSGLCLLLHTTFDFASAQLAVVPLGFLLSMSFARGRPSTAEAAHLIMVVISLSLCVYPILME